MHRQQRSRIGSHWPPGWRTPGGSGHTWPPEGGGREGDGGRREGGREGEGEREGGREGEREGRREEGGGREKRT